MKDEGVEIINHLIARAEAWAEANGLRRPFTSSFKTTEIIFKVKVQGENGLASCIFQKDGRPSLYERQL